MKKITTIFLAVLMILSLFAGCSKAATDDKEQVNEPEKQETEQTKEQEAEPVTITFWHNYDAGAGQIDVLDELIAQFEAENQNITVDQLYLEWSALKNNVITGATTNMLPDVLRGDIGFVPQFQSLDVLVEMDTRFDDYETAANAVLDAPNSTAKAGDHFYGIAANTNTKILYYNTDLIATTPTTLDEMWTAAENASNDDVTGFCEAWMGGWNVCQYIWSYGGDVLSPDNTTADGYINGEAAVEVISRLADMHAKGAFNGPSIDPGHQETQMEWAQENML